MNSAARDVAAADLEVTTMRVLARNAARLYIKRVYSRETFGLAIAEAMASGLPVVAVERGAAPDRIENSDCGRLYAHGSAVSCAQALREVSSAVSPLLRARVRRHAEQSFSWRRTFDQLLSVYQGVLATRAMCRAHT